MNLLRRWWRLRDHYDWILTYIRGHRLLPLTRFMLATLTMSMAAVPTILAAGGEGLQSAAGLAVSYTSTAVGVCGGMIWALTTPSRRASFCYVIACSLSITLASLSQTSPMVGLVACTAFSCVSEYLAFFHSARQLLYNFLVIAAVTTIAAVRLTASGHGMLAIGMLWLVLVVNVAVPVGVQLVVHTLGIDLLRTDRDPLTGLLNRRSFDRKVRELLTGSGIGGGHLVIIMIDLDRFKMLNDSRGHAAGDLALVHVAEALRSTARTQAVIGRAGGEEFLIADVVDLPEPIALAESLRAAIACGPHPVTASIGTASMPVQHLDHDSIDATIAHLAMVADLAMYEAKRAGGNQIRYADLDTGLRG